MRHARMILGTAMLLAPVAAALAALPDYTPVTDARLQKPEAGNWLMYRGNYSGWGYSPLDKINTGNVSKLQLAWSFSTGVTDGHQSPPIVNNGYMFVTTPQNQVIALDAKTGQQLWRYKKELPADLPQLHPTNRGVALYGNKVYLATVDCNLVALDAKTGKPVWTKTVCDSKALYYMTLAPLAAKGKIMVGSSGGETGVRGFVAAFDAETGNELWRTYTVPGPGEAGNDSWPKGDAYKNGGGSVWVTGNYDPATNLAYWGTGNPSPWPTEGRKGDNLYTTSTIALDVDTGKIKGHHQYHWNDAWDWDEVSAPLLIDMDIKGRMTKTAVHAGRDGYLWVLERTPDQINFVNAWAYVYNDVFTSIDKKTGRPSYDETKRPGVGKAVKFCPSLWGGKDWVPEAYNPVTGLLYVPANNNLCAELPKAEPSQYKKGDLYIGYPIEGVMGSLRFRDSNAPRSIGELQAWDLKTGKQVWTHKFPTVIWAPLMTTAGKLVFAGGSNDRMFRAFDAESGKVLWETPTPSAVVGVPTSFEIDGEQYIAVQSGWGVDAERMQAGMNALGVTGYVPQGGVVMVYKLAK